MIQYKVENITLTDDEKSFGDVEDIKDKAVIHAKSLLKKVLLEDARRELF